MSHEHSPAPYAACPCAAVELYHKCPSHPPPAPPPPALPPAGGTHNSQSKVVVALSKGAAVLPDLHVSDSSEALLSGRKPPFRLLVRAVGPGGGRVPVRHCVSEGFVVATRRTRTAGKVRPPCWAFFLPFCFPSCLGRFPLFFCGVLWGRHPARTASKVRAQDVLLLCFLNEGLLWLTCIKCASCVLRAKLGACCRVGCCSCPCSFRHLVGLLPLCLLLSPPEPWGANRTVRLLWRHTQEL